MRKDDECFFGGLKGRFRMLRCRLRFQKITLCNKLFQTCCSLHNLMIDKDGLDNDQETEIIQREIVQTPFAIEKLNCSVRLRNRKRFDRRRNSAQCVSEQRKKCAVDDKRVVHKMKFNLSQLFLVNHFDVRFKQKQSFGHK